MIRNSSIKGFTLIELSIVIIIMGLMMNMVTGVMKITMAGRADKETKANLQNAELALKSYLAVNGAFPCPAPRETLKGTPNYGKALADCISKKDGIGFGQIAAGSKTAIAEGRNKNPVRIGILPFRSLGIPDSGAVDGWGNLLQYAVTEILTDPVYYDQNDGALDVVAEDGQSRITPPASVQYVVYATGPDSLRGFTAMGTPTMSGCPFNVLQTENCDDDSVFMDTERRYAASGSAGKANYAAVYDDDVVYMQHDPLKTANGGVVMLYRGSCPPEFSPIDTEGLKIAGVEMLSLKPSSERGREEDRSLKPTLCYSPRYASTLMVAIEGNDEGSFRCPKGWDRIGYSIFNSYEEGSFDYQVCAR